MGHSKIWAIAALVTGLTSLAPTDIQARALFVCSTDEALSRAEAEAEREVMLATRIVVTDDGRIAFETVPQEQAPTKSLFSKLIPEIATREWVAQSLSPDTPDGC